MPILPSSLLRCVPIFLIVIWMSFALPSARSQVVVNHPVMPGGYEEVEGNSLLVEPFSPEGGHQSPFRFQQVYGASELAHSTGPLGGWIYAIGFRADGIGIDDSYQGYFSDFSIRFSVTDRGPDELSPVFAENVGSRVSTMVLGRTSIGVGRDNGQNPEPFTMFFTFLSNPYFYDPSQGNLLMEVNNRGGFLFGIRHGGVATLDAVDTAGDGVSSVIAGNIGNQVPTAGTVSTKGLVTSFRIVPVPEPSTWALLGLATVIFGGRFCHTLSRRKAHHVTH